MRPFRFCTTVCPAEASLASLPLPLRASRASGSVLEAWVVFERGSPWKSTLGFLPVPRVGTSPPSWSSPSSLGRKLFKEAAASIKVPSTLKCSRERNFLASASPGIFLKEMPATSAVKIRSRFLVKLVGCQAPCENRNPTSFTKNRDRILTAEVAGIFFEKIRGEAEAKKVLSREHFSVDGTLIEAAASLKSFRPKDEGEDQDGGDIPTRGTGRNPTVDFHGERRSNTTHASRTDPEARLARKGRGKEARLAYAGHIVVENRNGLIVDCTLTKATGTAEEEAALALLT